MTVIYLHHSGFAVILNNLTLIFDAITDIPEEILNKNHDVIFFVSHSHYDHYKKEIWNYEREGVYYVVSKDVWHRDRGFNIHYVDPYETIKIDKTVIRTFGSTDLGVSFLVETDNKVIFFSGDLNWWAWSPKTRPNIDPGVEERDYKQEIFKLKDYLLGKRIDLAFVPVDPRLDLHNGEILAARFFINTLHPKKLVPMHFWEDHDVIMRLKIAVGKYCKTEIGTFERDNQVVRFEN